MYFDVNNTPVITPAVFCASFEPWERLNAAAESNCSLRKYLSMRDGLDLRNSQYTAIIRKKADIMPMSGAPTIIFKVNPHSPPGPRFRASKLWLAPRRYPTWAMADPAYPPIRACEELVGRPSHQVIRSQMMAPDNPAMI